MAQNTFSMYVQKKGRMKYLLLVIGIPLLLMFLLPELAIAGILPYTELLGQIYFYVPLFIMCILSHLLIFRKNHSINIKNNTLIETDWRGKNLSTIKIEQIQKYRRNILGEIILLDKQGNNLLCAESNMTNFDAFQKWLERHDILENKEK